MKGFPLIGRFSLAGRWPLAAVVVCGLIVRLFYLFDAANQPGFFSPVLDSRYIVGQAELLLKHGRWTESGPFFRPPIYTLFMALCLAIGGSMFTFVAALLQLLLGVLFCGVMFLLCDAVFDRRAAIIAGLLCAFNSPLVFYEGELLGDSIAVFFYGLFLWQWLVAIRKNSSVHFALAGACAGLGAITRPNIIITFACFSVLCVVYQRGAIRTAIRNLVAFISPALLLIAMPTIYNWRTGDFNLIASQGGINFWIGNHAAANGLNVVLPYHVEFSSTQARDDVEELSMLLFLKAAEGEADGERIYFMDRDKWPRPSRVSRYWYNEAFQWLVRHPREAGALYLKKFIGLVTNREVTNNRDYHFIREEVSWVLRVLPVTYGVLVVLATLAITINVGSGNHAIRWLVCYLVVSAAGIAAFFVAGRLRLTLLPALIPLAGLGPVLLWDAWRAGRWMKIAPALGMSVIVGFGSFYAWPQLDFRWLPRQQEGLGLSATASPMFQHILLGQAALRSGFPAVAVEHGLKALEYGSEVSAPALFTGDAYAASGKWRLAGRYYRMALEREPGSARALNNLGVVAEHLGKFEAAADFYRYSKLANPYHMQASANLTALISRAEDPQGRESVVGTARLQNDDAHARVVDKATTATSALGLSEQQWPEQICGPRIRMGGNEPIQKLEFWLDRLFPAVMEEKMESIRPSRPNQPVR